MLAGSGALLTAGVDAKPWSEVIILINLRQDEWWKMDETAAGWTLHKEGLVIDLQGIFGQLHDHGSKIVKRNGKWDSHSQSLRSVRCCVHVALSRDGLLCRADTDLLFTHWLWLALLYCMCLLSITVVAWSPMVIRFLFLQKQHCLYDTYSV